jgi:hypothetical protein
MSEHKKKILEMLAQNKISADEAYRLLSVVDGGEAAPSEAAQDNQPREDRSAASAPPVKGKHKYLRVLITSIPGQFDGPRGPFDGHRGPFGGPPGPFGGPRFHEGDPPERVNVRIPISLIKAGIKMKALIPPEAKDKINEALKDKGIDFNIDTVKNEDIEELIEALDDMEIDIDGGHGEKIKVYVE